VSGLAIAFGVVIAVGIVALAWWQEKDQ